MKILILNWRDIDNPESGGAEVLTHEMAKRWVKSGHEVTQFSAKFPGSRSEEIKDGVTIIRQGSANIRSLGIPVHIAANIWYRKQAEGGFDVVIDEIHGIPFFTPLYGSTKKVALICEIAKGIWDATFSFPLNVIGRNIEQNYFHFYKNIPFLTISPSTKEDLLRMGIPERLITILPMGLNIPKRLPKFEKERNPTLIFVGRLTKAKGIEEALYTVLNLKKIYPKIKLWVVGQGDSYYMRQLADLAKQLNLEDNINFFGFVSQNKKFELMSKAHILIAPSLKEGWGLTVPESGWVGTPSIGYNVEGLRDVIIHGKTGLLVQPTPKQMSEVVATLVKDKKTYKKFQIGARQLAQTYSWHKTAKAALSVLNQA